LKKNELMKIIDMEMKKVFARLDEKGIKVTLSKKAKELLFEKGYDPLYGARPIRRAIEQNVEDPMSEEILRGKIPEGSKVLISCGRGKITFKVTKPEQQANKKNKELAQV